MMARWLHRGYDHHSFAASQGNVISCFRPVALGAAIGQQPASVQQKPDDLEIPLTLAIHLPSNQKSLTSQISPDGGDKYQQ